MPRTGFLTHVLAAAALATAALAPALPAQDRGSAGLAELLQGLGTTTRVLVVAAHPDDEDTHLISWLSRGRHVETAYLSLTRGDGGQNLIGDELGEPLGVIRTEELLAARRVDGGRQFFTRAYDFGFSKSVEETLEHWPRDSILRDVITVVRAFRPHVIVAVFSGTPRDGHGHHQLSGVLAREAYDLAGDSVRFPASETHGMRPWAPLKFYRGARFRPEEATMRMNVGEYSPLVGRSFAEIAGESRSQHRSQGFGALQRRGVVWDYVRREATRAPAPEDPKAEQSIFDGIDTTLAGLGRRVRCGGSGAMDSLARALDEARAAYDPYDPTATIDPLVRARAIVERVRCGGSGDADVALALDRIGRDVDAAITSAAGLAVEVQAERPLVAVGERMPLTVTVYNRGRRPVGVRLGDERSADAMTTLAPDSSVRWSDTLFANPEAPDTWARAMQPWWLSRQREGDIFGVPVSPLGEEWASRPLSLAVTASVAGSPPIRLPADVVYRFVDPVRGDVSRPVAAAPAVSVVLDRGPAELAPAGAPLDRMLSVTLRSASASRSDLRVSLVLPVGLTADSAVRTVSLPAYGDVATVRFRVRGRLPEGRHPIVAVAEGGGQRFTSGALPLEYEHIRPQRLYRESSVGIVAVDARLPRGTNVAYIRGVGDNVAPALEALGVPITLLDPSALPSTDLSRFTAVVVGPRAYEAHDALRRHNPRLLDYARAGGTLVVQYGQYEMTQPGMMPYPITINRPHDRVTEEDAPVTVVDASARVLTAPNRITARDFEGWVQERSLYMPRTFDERYRPVLEMNDPGAPPNRGAILVAPVGRGTYVYTTLALFRQLPAGVPGAARLFLNLLAAGSAGGAQ